MEAQPRSKKGQPPHRTTGRRQGQLDPSSNGAKQRPRCKHRRQQGKRKRRGDPHAPRHVYQFWIGCVCSRHGDGFERHAAFRARTRTIAHDLWVHGAGILRAFGSGFNYRGSGRLRSVVLMRRRFELGTAAIAAEIPGAPIVLSFRFRRLRRHLHAAYRVDYVLDYLKHRSTCMC